jgi:hypothetical protein
MGDMSQIIIPKSDQINADDLQGGRTVTVSVKEVRIKGGQEQPISIHLNETDKVYRPCKSMCRVLAQGWGLDSAQYVGRAMTLYTDPTVKFGPLAVGGIRISHMSHIDGPMVMALTATKGVKKSFKVLPLETRRDAEPQHHLSIEQAEADLRDAGTLDDLKTAWSRKTMAPHRAALQSVLDERKQALSEPEQGRAEEEMGEANNGAPQVDPREQEIIAEIDSADGIDALGDVMKRNRSQMSAMSEDATKRIWEANARRKAALGRAAQ